MTAKQYIKLSGSRRVVLNMGFLLMTRIAAMASSLVFVVIVARKWGPAGYGQYALVLVFISYFAFLSNFGLDRVAIQRVAAGDNAGIYLVNSLVARLGLSCLAILCIIGIMWVSGRPDLFLATVIASGSMMANSLYQAFSALFQAQERMDVLAFVELPITIVRSGLGIVVVLGGHRLVPLLSVYLLVDAFQALVGLVVYLRIINPILKWPQPSYIFGLIRSGAPLAMWVLSSVIEFRIGVIVLSYYWGDTVVGLYAAPYKVVDLTSITTLAMTSALLPTFSRLFAKSRESFARAYGVACRLILIVFLPVAVGTTVLAKPLVVLFFGPEYLASSRSLQLLVWAVVAMSLQYLGGTALLAIGRWGRIPLLGIIVVVSALLAAFLLIPTWGNTGAALALIISEIVNACVTFLLVWRYTQVWPELHGLDSLVASLAVWGTLLWLVREVNVLIVLAGAIPLYLLLVLIFKAVKPDDLELAAAFLPQRVYAKFFRSPVVEKYNYKDI